MQPSIDAKGRWRVVCLAPAQPAELGLARHQTLADELTSESAAPALLLWRAEPALLVTRQETRLPLFREASEHMDALGWPILVRKSGGGACPVGPGTVQVATIEPAAAGATMGAKYDALTQRIQSALFSFRIASQSGSVADAFCPGNYDIAVQGKKIAGMSQHWFRNRCGIRCVVTSASLNVEESPDVLADVVNRFCDAAGSPARCRATALTNMRWCAGDALLAAPNLLSAVIDRLASSADIRPETGTRNDAGDCRAILSAGPVTEHLI